ncbi:GntR family transcriptional regulator [Paroceanicella profunda]|uniref:GntR family transcriptional regulator n=1 Tax=Paroceanicella profunda TaxID=2579971 RepID=A0A5B8FFV6_9RHOB|nr:GntR family transcriptional regulator [Paroceanicella profunda]QDL90327.1 GntR family transcriptional regulator [Paroceanicella profunda]
MTDSDRIQRTPPLADQVYRGLRELMREHAFKPGERLVEANLARRLDVSRTPVREALSRLASDGLVEFQDGGVAVLRLTLEDVEEIFEIRRLLEPPAAAQVARSLGPQDNEAFRAALARAEAARSVIEFSEANIAFRGLWVSRIANRRLRKTLLRFDDQVSLVRRTTLVDPRARSVALDGLRRLATAFLAGDAGRAAAEMAEFVDSAFEFFEAAFPEDRP